MLHKFVYHKIVDLKVNFVEFPKNALIISFIFHSHVLNTIRLNNDVIMMKCQFVPAAMLKEYSVILTTSFYGIYQKI